MLLLILLLLFEHLCVKHSFTYSDYIGKLDRQDPWESLFRCKLSPISQSQSHKWIQDRKCLARDAITLVGTKNVKPSRKDVIPRTGTDNKAIWPLISHFCGYLLLHSCPLTLILAHVFLLSITTVQPTIF